MLVVALLAHQLTASSLIDILQEEEQDCYCKCPCNVITSTSTTTTTTLPPLLNICEPNLTGYFPYPDDRCKKYVYCSRGLLRFTTLECTAGQYFTPGNNACTADVPEGCDTPDAGVFLYDRVQTSGERKSIEIKWGQCYNLEETDMNNRVSSISFWKNDCLYLCDTNECDGNCITIRSGVGDIGNCERNLGNCDFDKRAKSIKSCFFYGDQ